MCVFHIKISIKVIFYYLYCRSCPTVLDTTVRRLLPFFICSSWALNKIHIIFKVENICTSLVVQLEFSIFHRNFFFSIYPESLAEMGFSFSLCYYWRFFTFKSLSFAEKEASQNTSLRKILTSTSLLHMGHSQVSYSCMTRPIPVCLFGSILFEFAFW